MAGSRESNGQRIGKRPGIEIYRRLTEPIDAAEQKRIARYVLAKADEIDGEEQGACGIEYLAFLAACTRKEHLFSALIGRSENGGALSYSNGDLLTEDDVDRLECFWDFAGELVREGRREHPRYFGPRNRIVHQRWLEDEGLRSAAAIRRADKNAFRFLERLRCDDDPDKPELFRDLPAIVPWWQQRWLTHGGPALAAALALIAAMLASTWRGGDARVRGGERARAGMFATIDIGGQTRMLEGSRDGSWRLATPDGRTVFSAPDELRLPDWIEGGAAGDLTGDGRPEIVLYTSASIHAPEIDTGIFVFTRAGDGWRRLARLPTHEPGDGPDRCDAVRARLETEPLDDELERARELCPSLISEVRVIRGELLIFQSHYGRQLLRVRCTDGGCSPPEPVLSVRADLTSAAVVRDAADRERLVIGTGCWRENSERAYGLLIGASPPAGDGFEFVELGGRTAVAALDGDRFAALSGIECEKLGEARLFADTRPSPGRSGQRRLLIARLDRGGSPVIEQEIPFEVCCHEGSRVIAVAPDVLAVIHPTSAANLWQVTAFDRSRPLAEQTPARSAPMLGAPESIAAIDVDGDGAFELLIGTASAGAGFRFARAQGRLGIERLEL